MKNQDEIQHLREMLQLCREREKELARRYIQSMNTNGRNVAYADLQSARNVTKEIQEELEELEGKITGHKPRKAFGVIPRDW